MAFNRRAVVWFAAIIVVVNGFFPAVWILLTSFKTETELLKVPITYWPHAPTLDNYVTAFTAQPILRFMWNSFVVAGLVDRRCACSSARLPRTRSRGCACRIATSSCPCCSRSRCFR